MRKRKVSKLQKRKEDVKGKYWLNKADRAWALEVKARAGACEICGATEHLNSHHIIPREVKATRHIPENGICLCVKHHKYGMESIHKNPAKVLAWIRCYLPSRYDWIIHNIHNVSTKPVDYKEAYERLAKDIS